MTELDLSSHFEGHRNLLVAQKTSQRNWMVIYCLKPVGRNFIVYMTKDRNTRLPVAVTHVETKIIFYSTETKTSFYHRHPKSTFDLALRRALSAIH